MIDIREIRHFHLFAGLGGGAKEYDSNPPGRPGGSPATPAASRFDDQNIPF